MARSGHDWRSEELGEMRRLELAAGTIRCYEAGSGPTLVFAHGALVNANLWRHVVARLSPRFRCVALDLPLGGHLEPMPRDADLTPPALADLIADAVEAVAPEGATLVANDTGGALSQLVVTRRPEAVSRLVLTSCDAFDNFPPKAMQPAMPLLRMPGSMWLVAGPMAIAPLRRRATTLMRISKRPVDARTADSYALPPLRDAGVRRDTGKVVGGLDKRWTLEAAERLHGFERPVLIAWSREDKFFPTDHARRLSELFPDARLEWIEDSYTFSPEDNPDRLADLIADFAGESTGTPEADAAERATPA